MAKSAGEMGRTVYNGREMIQEMIEVLEGSGGFCLCG